MQGRASWLDYFVVSKTLVHRVQSIDVQPGLTRPHHAVTLHMRGRQPDERVWVQRTKRRFPESDTRVGPFPQCSEAWTGNWESNTVELDTLWRECSAKAERYLVEARSVGEATPKWFGRGSGPLRKCIPLAQAYGAHIAYTPDAYAWRRLSNLAEKLQHGRVPARRRERLLEAAFSCPQ
eukprot:5715381-Amphidinium_carterae.1